MDAVRQERRCHATALAHEPQILFSTSHRGRGVELGVTWALVRSLAPARDDHLTPHYRRAKRCRSLASSARASSSGRKRRLRRKLGKKQVTLQLQTSLERSTSGCRDP